MIRSKKKLKLKKPKKTKQNYRLNPRFEFFNELQALILKASPAERGSLVKKINKLGRVKLAVVSGIFLNRTSGMSAYEAPADLFAVIDDVNKRKLNSFLQGLEAEAGCEIRFTLMDKDEFDYRHGMFDRFIRVLFEGPHEKIINKLGI
ncbi:MAG: hypothetical protein A2750_03915 [Candidatus Yanofskybacteria bacterium RIFCSPHIGHO2_01_FULL_45_42]|uniref:Polymerase beta nucleotidyltransferase domain-containing protein n=3 Tax=Candidatus Yanofskyibacteriota TaxID=1752733 RepID=A0A1F8H3E7_9BACT|nr:MAG: hypothetical protein A2750_03915 [Candidatus Yanofskybacteria bacterium RIFCSPHIGHO2_01_FULL_45_42]OGN16259.1 MAG: hypothetical protein A3C81_00020 [Candidatus Yanofskybacteria bacterium RIFCSPHIGHO2_02_FULL_46_19]OGN26154.1 MAG: hypothetical protein A3B17_02240 [Candidatus Yanofskybacteria bacterium RIFCSPLOWO2_01_FULL_45_72]OGN32125.1 MAG: hypothetical protein A3J01_00825 [Candidatus Yanofskybacteria bacterium RIFCSPLOWO2_02_FULL_45_18]